MFLRHSISVNHDKKEAISQTYYITLIKILHNGLNLFKI